MMIRRSWSHVTRRLRGGGVGFKYNSCLCFKMKVIHLLHHPGGGEGMTIRMKELVNVTQTVDNGGYIGGQSTPTHTQLESNKPP